MPVFTRIVEDFAYETEVPVPDPVRKDLVRILKGARKVKVRWNTSGDSWKTIDTLELDSKPGEYPKQGVDEVAGWTMQTVDAHWKEAASEEEPKQRYRIETNCVLVQPGNKTSEKHQSFSFQYEGDYGADDVRGSDEDAKDRAQDRMFAAVTHTIDALQSQNAELHQSVLKLAEQNSQNIEPVLKMHSLMLGTYLAGHQAQQENMQQMYDTKRVEIQERAKGQRMERFFAVLQPAINIAAQQFFAHAANMGFAAAPPQPKAPPQPPQDSSEEPSLDDERLEEELQEPLALLLRSIGQNLEPAHWKAATQIFTKKQFQRLADLLEVQTDIEALECYQLVENDVPIDKLIQFAQGHLDAELTQNFMGALGMIQQRAANGGES